MAHTGTPAMLSSFPWRPPLPQEAALSVPRRLLVFVVAVVLTTAGASRPVLDDGMIQGINTNASAGWKAAHNVRFKGLTLLDASALLGTLTSPRPRLSVSLKWSVSPGPRETNVNFDARDKWPVCTCVCVCVLFGAPYGLSACVASAINLQTLHALTDLLTYMHAYIHLSYRGVCTAFATKAGAGLAGRSVLRGCCQIVSALHQTGAST